MAKSPQASQKNTKSMASDLAWSDGSRVWILPALSTSRWTKKLDWLLNFQISKSSRFQRKDINPDFLKTLSGLGLELDWKEEESPQINMVLTLGKLPCEAVIVMPDGLTKKAVLKHTLKIVEDLKRPNVRLFPMDSKSERWPDLNDIKSDLPTELVPFIEVVSQPQ